MKLMFWLTTALLLACATGCSIVSCKTDHQYNNERLQRLLATKECQGCNLWHADLSEAKLAEVNLRLAALSDAYLYAADLRGVDLTEAKFSFYWDTYTFH
ncbi:MAG: pentapeptide repeat-containing protein [Leptolyngbya sp. BL-A-14]